MTIDDVIRDYEGRIDSLRAEPTKLKQAYADGFIRGLLLAINDLRLLREGR